MSFDPSRFKQNEYVNTDWTITVEAGTSIEDVMNPAFFANVAAQLHPYDHIRVRIDTGEWYAELLVVSCARVWAKTKLIYAPLKLTNDEVAPENTDSQYSVEFKGPHNKWVVIRKTDRETLKKGFENQQEANVWLSAHLMAL